MGTGRGYCFFFSAKRHLTLLFLRNLLKLYFPF
uniref:Uncharacterized protein n=1 Tax=Rhizophora mucronata TaxID=61149 RepID=A0A2P2PVB3_RHIMU